MSLPPWQDASAALNGQDTVRAKQIGDILLAEYGAYVQPINHPTVPRGTERPQYTPGPAHTEAMMQMLTGEISALSPESPIQNPSTLSLSKGCTTP